MPSADDLSTSASLLAKLVDPENREAWRRFLDRYQPFIYTHCKHHLRDHHAAEDMAATVLLKIARKMKTFRYDPNKSFRGWLRTVISRSVQDAWRRQQQEPQLVVGGSDTERRLLEAVDPASVGLDAEPLIDAVTDAVSPRLERQLALAHQAMEQVRGRVKPHRWVAFWQTAVEGRPAKEVAQELRLSVNDVFVAKSHIGAMLRKRLAELEAEAAEEEGGTS